MPMNELCKKQLIILTKIDLFWKFDFHSIKCNNYVAYFWIRILLIFFHQNVHCTNQCLQHKKYFRKLNKAVWNTHSYDSSHWHLIRNVVNSKLFEPPEITFERGVLWFFFCSLFFCCMKIHLGIVFYQQAYLSKVSSFRSQHAWTDDL